MSRSPSQISWCGESLALLDDLLERRDRRGQVGDGDDPPAAAVVQLVGHLPRRVAAEERLLAELGGEPLQRLLDRLVELADRLELVVLGRAVVLGGTLDLEEHFDGIFRELPERDLERLVRVREVGGVGGHDPRLVDLG